MSAPLRRIRRAAAGGLLGPLEAEIMTRFWRRGPATVRDVVEELTRDRDLAYTTVMTVMVRLKQKGLLRRDRVGKTYHYRAALTRREHEARVSRDLARGLVARFGDAALAAFSAELAGVDAERRAALRRLGGGRRAR